MIFEFDSKIQSYEILLKGYEISAQMVRVTHVLKTR